MWHHATQVTYIPVLQSYCRCQHAAVMKAQVLKTHLYLVYVQAAHCLYKRFCKLLPHKAALMTKWYSV